VVRGYNLPAVQKSKLQIPGGDKLGNACRNQFTSAGRKGSKVFGTKQNEKGKGGGRMITLLFSDAPRR